MEILQTNTMELEKVKNIKFPTDEMDALLSHCMRKYERKFIEGEALEQKAYGLIAGVIDGESALIKKICPLIKTARHSKKFDNHMTKLMGEHAIPSKTPFKRRGWVSDPDEMFDIYSMCDQEDHILIASYHMHIVPWKGDPIRDTPTDIDKVLAKGSNIFQLIVSFVEPKKPLIRVFFEGVLEKEVPIVTL